MTLIELTVVILVLLTLISVLFIGAQAYKNAADRSACILNIRNTHQGVRALQNTSGAAVTDTFLRASVIGTGKFVENEPLCPTNPSTVAGGAASYTVLGAYPAVGTCSVTCTVNTATAKDHKPNTTNGW